MDKDRRKSVQQLGVYITIPFVLAVPPVIGWLIGSYLDEWLNTEPYLMFLFLLLGFVAGFRELFRIIKRYGDGI